MAHISSVGAGIFSELAYVTTAIALASQNDVSQADWEGAGTFTDVADVREFPSFNTPANVVNVPVYGQKNSDQIVAQTDQPALEFTLNWVPSSTIALEGLVGDGNVYAWRIRVANAALPATLEDTTEHDDFYVYAQVAGFEVNLSLADANTATLTLATSGDFFGPFTTTA